MKKAIFMIIVNFTLLANSSEHWFCTDDQAMRSGDTLMICGIGTSSTEGEARQHALNNAIYEFKTICALDSNCSGKRVQLDPKRTSCFENKELNRTSFEKFICHRMFLFALK